MAWLCTYDKNDVIGLVNSDKINYIQIEKFDHKTGVEKAEFIIIGVDYISDCHRLLSRVYDNMVDAEIFLNKLFTRLNRGKYDEDIFSG